MNTQLLLDWLIPSLAGFGLGYLTCLLVRRAVEDSEAPTPERQRRAMLARVVFGILLIALGSASSVQVWLTTQCTSEALRARSEAQGAETRAQIELFEAILDGDRSNNREAEYRYLDAARELERVRVENPLECG